MFWPHKASYQFAHYTAYGTFITVLLRIFLINCSKAFLLLSVFQVNQLQDVINFVISRKKKRKMNLSVSNIIIITGVIINDNKPRIHFKWFNDDKFNFITEQEASRNLLKGIQDKNRAYFWLTNFSLLFVADFQANTRTLANLTDISSKKW